MSGYVYIVCDICAHVETRPATADDPERCENCSHGALWQYDDADHAEQHSQDILDRKPVAEYGT